jgi:hypothetical protein
MNKTDCPSPPEDGWEAGYREHNRAQRRRLAELSFRQKLEWLDEVDRFLERLKAARRLYLR